MINIERETLLTITEARNHFPNRPSRQTLYRWLLRGVRGVVLESLCLGGRRFTSREAIARFVETSNPRDVAANSRSTNRRQEDRVSAAKQVLDRFRI